MSVLAKLVGFLRDGYPDAAPSTGYLPVLALLGRRLSDDEVSAVAANLAACDEGADRRHRCGVAVTRITHGLPAAGAHNMQVSVETIR